jgi:hypothetical protein
VTSPSHVSRCGNRAGGLFSRLEPAREKQDDQNDQDNAEDANAAVAIAIAVAAEAATEPAEERDYDDDDEDEAERHRALLSDAKIYRNGEILDLLFPEPFGLWPRLAGGPQCESPDSR